ncbi:hypothetical protein LZ683_08965 [Comamonas testosteroni]|uniref:hypothetical protein n=1 Tax=Comamonas testosteroni TaxID=285 RepID=UPI0023AB4200|nr:hypothetical protein [Comamonas testosteroni]WEE79472.1 hypothetical protein LZ683_08965 [Comamonas testosteroni]
MPVKTNLMPAAGIDNRQEDAALVVGGEAPRVYFREALNVNITEAGRVNMRGAVRKVTDTPFKNAWSSHLHGDLFGTLGTDWVKINPTDWSHEVLANLGSEWTSCCVLNGKVVAAGAAGLFAYDGRNASRMTIDTPSQPFVTTTPGGALVPGDYGVAVSWLRGSLESSVSHMEVGRVAETGGSLSVGLPYCIDPSVTTVRLYLTKPGSRELQRAGDWPISQGTIEIAAAPELGASPEFQFLDAMPTGRFVQPWRGRLLTASFKTLNFSEPMAWHLHDRRHGFIQFPQRITFVAAVDGGIWVGQVDHVLFLSGAQPDELQQQRRASKPPVPASAVLLDSDLVGELAGPGSQSALWLAENGYVLGTSDGQMVELQRKRLTGIKAASGATTVWGSRVLTVLG